MKRDGAPAVPATPAGDAIAIVGVAGRFPGARTVGAFWRNLEAGVESISRFSEAELEDAFSDEVRRAPNFVRARPILEDVDQFDAEFFGMYAREAELTDPQQRLFLECAWEALEDAGCDPRRYRGAIGVFAGCSINTYFLHHVCTDRRALEEFTSNYQVGCYPQLLGAGLDFLATRVSYKLDLRGPSLDLQTACSTSLLAVAQACQSLLLYQADMALAGGVSISFPQKRGYLHQEGAMVSADGTCRPFDAKASGTVFGSGAGVVALKRLADALAEGDHVYAVIRGCGVNNDGATKVGFTAPSIAGQAAAIEMALANAGVSAESIGYVECHGTATPLGDPIEVAALTQAFRGARARGQFCALGSVKSNIGHLDAAAGVVGLIKTALALERGVLPASLHYTQPNPQIDFAATPFYVNAQRTPWPRGSDPRRAGVSAFGIGGTNVHVIVEEAPLPPPAAAADARAQLLVLSARSPTALTAARASLAAYLRAHPQADLADVACTLQLGRRAFEHRSFVVAGADAAPQLEAPAAPGSSNRSAQQRVAVAFMFPGQGAQYPQMARDLYLGNAVFRSHFDACAAICRPHLDADLAALVYPAAGAAAAAAALTATSIAQPAIFAVEYSLAQLWMSLGIEPAAMIGHSVGEFVAAVLSGVMRLEDALPVIVARGRLMQQLPAGAMLAVRLPESQLRPLLGPGSDIAAVNAPNLSVASGPEAEIEALATQLTQREIGSRRLQTSHAFHSPMVEPVTAPLEKLLERICLSAPHLPYVSCVSGTWITPAQATSPRYWARHARETVRFADGVAALARGDPAPILLEVGPGNVTSTLALQTLGATAAGVVTSLQDAARESSDRDCLLGALGKLWTLGAQPHWEALHEVARRRVSLPTYPFERKRFWIEAPARSAAAAGAVVAAAPARDPDAAVSFATSTAEAPDKRGEAMSAAIGAILEQLSGNAPASLTATTTFLEMGYDSLFLTQVAQKIQSQMRVPLTFRQLLREYPHIPALASFLAERSTGAAATAGGAGAAPAAAVRPSRFAVFAPATPLAGESLTREQQQHIEDLTARYTRRTAESKRQTQAQRAVLADPRAVAGFRSEWKELVYPLIVTRSAGSKLWDVDGNEYVDLVNGYGGTAFGHAPDFVVEAVRAQLERGFAIGPQTELAGKVATLLSELTGNERVTFCNTGSEAVMAAMRLARTVTGRDKIVVFNGDYHGQFDEVLVKGVQHAGAAPRSVPVAPGIPHAAVENMIVLEYATAATLEWLRAHASELAAVVVEPVQSRHPALQPFEFLREVAAITQASGTAFVLDEVVTGFRTHPGGIQALAGIRADMATYGKVVGGGLPIGILAGNSRFMDALDGGTWRFGDASVPEVGVTFFAGTFVRHPLVLAAALAVLEHLKREGPQLQERLAARTASLASNLNTLFEQQGIVARVESFASWFYFNIHAEHSLAALLFYHLRLRGLHIQDGFPCFLTTAHSDADLRHIFQAFSESVAELASVGVFPGAAALKPAPVAATEAVTGEALPLTESQTEIWLAAQMGDEASCAFNESVSLRLRGALDEAALRRSLALLFERHDALRTAFGATGETMWVRPPRAPELALQDLSAHAEPESALEGFIAEDASRPFDLVNGPPARVQLVRLGTDHHVLIFTAHHIVCDGWSINVIVSELATLYAQYRQGLSPQLPPALSFSAYARAQARRDPAEAALTRRFWLERFREPVPPLELPTDRPRPPLKSYRGASRTRRIDAALYRAIKQAGAKSGSTLFVTLLGAFQGLLGRLSGQREVVIDVPTAGQSLIGEQILVGHCVNFLPIRARWDAQTAVGEHLRALAREVLDAADHSNYTLGTLVRELAQPREGNRMPLAEIQFNLERLSERLELPGLSVEVTPNAKAHVVFDLFLNIIESDAGLRLDCDYNTDLFDAATIDHWLECYEALLQSIVTDAARPLARIPYLPAAERERLLYTYNDSAHDFPRARCIHELIAAQARAHPEAVAVEFGAERLSYAALEAGSNQLATLLRERLGGRGGCRVAVAVERSAQLPAALLAVLKAGCAYVPLEPAHPEARLRHILEDAGVAALITDGSVGAQLLPEGVAVLHLREDAAALAATPEAAPAGGAAPADLAYVMYTSGSTGLPKGVEVEHHSVVNFLAAMARSPGLTAEDVLLAVTTVSFDIAALELYLPLSVGARVVIAARETLADGFALRREMEAHGVTAMQATPATWRLLLEAGFCAPPGFKMLCGGEALTRELATRLQRSAGVLWNLYGPTETTIWSSCGRVAPGDAPVSVGRPIANTQFYVLDAEQQPVAQGMPGELYIGGEGVARGYHGRPELTAQKFLPNPFAAGRVYRSGDLARWLPDGELALLGRTDTQVKLRGSRIELGEIENALARLLGLEAAVLLREDTPGSARLVAYYRDDGSAHTPEALRTALAAQLPEVMIPSAWVVLKEFPLNAHGKLDRAALPAAEPGAGGLDEFVAPRTPTELCLARIWGEVLHLPRVGANMDLLRLGADSIQLFQIIARSTREGIRLTARQLLQERTLRAVAALADAAAPAADASAAQAALPTLGQFQRERRPAVTRKR
jgi:amino acid adenylation domain-containing protein